jgi:S1-C subfamily serine protease
MLPLLLAALLAPQSHAKSRWESTIEEAIPSIVSIKISSVRSFDTESAGNSQGTGFVVDAKRGIILTNRHLVEPGPVLSEAIFLNNEEVALRAIYRDPVHDFGFYQFDPNALKYMKLKALDLNPEGAKVGIDVRLIGNDEGEKISILSGTLARLDRTAPNYGNGFNDFNTFYIQAASGTSGGSSGSPVMNQKGDVVALNAGGSRRGASSFYLPLHRVVRALKNIQAGQEVTRGSLQWTLRYTPFDELRRLGLRPETEKEVRSTWKDGTGMLVIREVLAKGPAGEHLQPGDILTHLGGELISTFLPLETQLDASVGESVSVTVERGGQVIQAQFTVDDLHALSPSTYIEVAGGVIHPLSYQKARHYSIPVEGLFVAHPGFMLRAAGVPDSALIREVGGEPVPTLDALWEVLQNTPDGQSLPIRYATLSESWREQIALARMDHKWAPLRRCERNDSTRFWQCTDGSAPEQSAALAPKTTQLNAQGPTPVAELAQSLVMVDFDIAHRVEGVYGTSFRGSGVILDEKTGLILVDRDTTPVAMGDCMVTFGGAIRVPCKVEFVHPIHNFSVLSYAPEQIGKTAVKAIVFAENDPIPGEEVWQVGLSSRYQMVWRKSRVARVEPLRLSRPSPPRFRDINVETIRLDDYTPTVGGLLANEKGEVTALWASYRSEKGGDSSSFFRGLPVSFLKIVLDPLLKGEPTNYRTLGIELGTVDLADAQEMGLSATDAKAFETVDPLSRQILSVSRLFAGTPAESLLEGGDLLLEVAGKHVTRFSQFEALSQAETVSLRVLRNGKSITVEVPSQVTANLGVEQVLQWQGALLHKPHFDLAAQRGIKSEGVYISYYAYGSPASRYGLRATRRILEVDSKPTPDLVAFMAAVAGKENGDSVRIQTVALDNQVHVTTLKINNHYWPTRVFDLKKGVWEGSKP